MLNEVNQMDAESILKPIDNFLEAIKGTELEERALKMKQEIEREIDNYNNQLKADDAHEEWLSVKED